MKNGYCPYSSLLTSPKIKHLAGCRSLRFPARALALLVSSALFVSSCGTERKKLKSNTNVSKSESVIAKISRAEGIEKRVLLVTAHNQSQFGQNTSQPLPQQTARASYFGMPASSTGPIDRDNLSAQVKLIARKIRELADATPPTDAFDWLVLSAHVIVGQVSDDPNIRDLSLRTVLVELIETYNSGFTASLSDGGTISVPPLAKSERVSLGDLDERQAQYINGFRFRRDFGSDFFLAGPEEGATGEKGAKDTPQLLVVWCPAGNLICLEHFRKTTKTPVHFLATHTLEGALESVQFYPVVKDLSWNGQALENTIVLAVSGNAGHSPETFRPGWLQFPEYAALRGLVRNIFDQTLRKFFGGVEAENRMAEPGFFRNHVKELTAAEGSARNISLVEGEASLILPHFWDSQNFWEVLESPLAPRAREQLLVSQPELGRSYKNFDVPFSLLIADDVRSIEIYQDAAPGALVDGTAWELVMKRQVDPTRRKREKFTHPFTRQGALAGEHRASKIVVRDIDGRILSSQVVRFQVRGIAD